MRDGFVLFLEDNDDLRDAFVDVVTDGLKRRCVGIRSYGELLELGEDALRCAIAVLDINLGPGRPSGVTAYQWLRKNGYAGQIVFLTGHASTHPLVVEAQRIGDAQVYAKPIDAGLLRTLIEGETPIEGQAPR